MTWNNITLKQFTEIQSILNDTEYNDEEKVLNLCLTVFGDFPLMQLNEKAEELKALLGTEIQTVHDVQPTIKIGNTTYCITKDVTNITTAQFIDFQEALKAQDLKQIVVVWFVPKGKKYNEGYNIKDVEKDIETLPITLIQSIAFFLLKKIRKLSKTTLLSSMGKILIMKIPMKKKLMLLSTMIAVYQNTDLLDLPLK